MQCEWHALLDTNVSVIRCGLFVLYFPQRFSYVFFMKSLFRMTMNRDEVLTMTGSVVVGSCRWRRVTEKEIKKWGEKKYKKERGREKERHWHVCDHEDISTERACVRQQKKSTEKREERAVRNPFFVSYSVSVF